MAKSRVESSRFPMKEFDSALSRLLEEEIKNVRELEFDVLSFFAGFLFLYCGKAKKKEVYYLCEFALRELKHYFPKYYKNPYVGIFKSKELPFINRLCIKIFVVTSRLPFFQSLVYLVTRVTQG